MIEFDELRQENSLLGEEIEKLGVSL